MVSRPFTTPIYVTFHQLVLLGFFFAMRSCENFLVTGERRTNAIRLRNIIFRRHSQEVPHSSPTLEHSDCVTLIFEFQKRDQRNDQVTHCCTGHLWRCPVKAAAAIVRRLQKSNATDDTYIYSYTTEDGRHAAINSSQALTLLRSYVASVKHRNYGIKPDEVGLHSLRSSAAMAMALNGVPTFQIRLLGRWSSEAFLLYIRKQVEQFSQDVSRRMIENPTFHHVDNPDANDPRSTRNQRPLAANLGMGSGRSTRRSAFHVWE